MLCGHIGTSCQDFAYELGPCFDALLCKDIQVEITEVSTAGQLLCAIEQVPHDLVMLMFNPCIHACRVPQANWAPSSGQPAATQRVGEQQHLPKGRDFIRLVRNRTLKPIFVVHNGSLLAHGGRKAIVGAGADMILGLPFSHEAFARGLRRFLHGAAFRHATPVWKTPELQAPGRVIATIPALAKRFTTVAAIQVAAIRHTFSTCVRAVEQAEVRRNWIEVGGGKADTLLSLPMLESAGLVIVMMNTLAYPPEYAEMVRYEWLIAELRVRTAAFILALNSQWHTPDALFDAQRAGADLALPVPFDLETAFEAVRSAHDIWTSGR